MPLSKQKKKDIIGDLKDKVERQRSMVFADFKGLKVKDLSDLKKKLKEIDAALVVVKKTLIKLAFKEAGLERIDPKSLQGQLAVIFGFKDEVMPAKIVYQFSQKNTNLKILGGLIESQRGDLLATDRVIELAKLSSREELLGRLVGSVASPISGFANVLQGNIRNLVYVLNAIKK